MSQGKPRVIKDFDKLTPEVMEQIKLIYPYGFTENLITFTNKDGKLVSALPFETDEKYYMIRMTEEEAEIIIDQDDDYDDDGILKSEIKEEYAGKYSDIDYIADNMNTEETESTDDVDVADEEDPSDFDDDDEDDDED